ncbi:efflux RND transporter periplasmic adaptor subunit [Alkalimarinus coralli]|uniref:efflux RND transporter periplasmic adaptor subunit n=1 Tax=Alkalimarinus coralli TaxID=2935863 RepID=UPI00202B7D06|nr:efflux RND transporter periplasmic adaptor subunit [Alkalimarinus coralli]
MLKRMSIMIIILAIVFGGIFWFLGYFKPKMVNQYFSSFQPPPVSVSSATAETSSRTPFLESTGTVIAVQEVVVTTEVAGLIQSINFKSGQDVDKGALLVKLDTSVDQAELKGLIASGKLAEANFKRDKQLIERKAVSSLDYETSLASLSTAEANIESQKATISKKSIRAPFSGKLGIRKVDLGEYLQAGSPIVSLQALDQVYVNFSLPEHHFSQVRLGQTAIVTVAAWPEKEFKGQITAIDSRISEATRNFTIQATIDNPEHELLPGMFSEVRLITGQPRDLVTVPEQAVERKLYGTSVFVISETNAEPAPDSGEEAKTVLTVERRYIKTGLTLDGYVEVISGLEDGEQVVVAGQLKLQNGSHVVINNTVKLN